MEDIKNALKNAFPLLGKTEVLWPATGETLTCSCSVIEIDTKNLENSMKQDSFKPEGAQGVVKEGGENACNR